MVLESDEAKHSVNNPIFYSHLLFLLNKDVTCDDKE